MAKTALSAYTWVTAANVETNNPAAFDKLRGAVMPEAEKVEAEEPKADAKASAKKEDTKTEDK